MKKISVACISVALTVLTVFIGGMVVTEVGSVHDYFFPSFCVNIENPSDDEWQTINFENTNGLVFDSIFYKKEVVNDANSDGTINIRIRDKSEKIVLDETTMEPGTSLDLNMLKKNTEYVVEIKTKADFVFLNFY